MSASKTLHQIISMERAIVGRFISDAIAAGYRLRVHNGKEVVSGRLADADRLLAVMFTGDGDTLYVSKAEGKGSHHVGFIQFIYGGDGFDVIADHSLAGNPIITGARALARSYEDLQIASKATN